MYQYHPTIMDRFSSMSVSEQVIWVRGIASGGNATGLWAVRNTPQPEVDEPRVVFAELSLILYQGCEHEVILVRLNIIQNDPSSEPDDWRTACLPLLTVFKPIKDGINNWVRDVVNAFNLCVIDYYQIYLHQ